MSKRVFNPAYLQYEVFSTPKDPFQRMMDEPIATAKKSEFESLLDSMRLERQKEYEANIPQGPYAEELREPSISMPEEKPIGLLSDRKYEGSVQEEPSKPMSGSERAEIVKALSSGALTAGKSIMELEQFKRDAKLKTELEKAKQLFTAQQANTESQVGNLRNYVANLKAALGGRS